MKIPFEPNGCKCWKKSSLTIIKFVGEYCTNHILLQAAMSITNCSFDFCRNSGPTFLCLHRFCILCCGCFQILQQQDLSNSNFSEDQKSAKYGLSVDVLRISSITFLDVYNAKLFLGFEMSWIPAKPWSLIPILFHGWRLFYGLHIFS